MRRRVYLAGPDVFFVDAARRGQNLKEMCASLGFEGVFPLDADFRSSDKKGPELARALYESNLEHLLSCQLVLAHVAPFRGPSMDVGTAFEMGVARAMGLPIFAYSYDRKREYVDRVGQWHLRNKKNKDAVVDMGGMLIENFGLSDNLMVACSPVRVCENSAEALMAANQYFRELDAKTAEEKPKE